MNFNNPLQSTHQKTNAKSWISISSSSASNSFFSQNYSIKTIPNQTRYVKYTQFRKKYFHLTDHEIFLRILYRSMTYVRKYNQRTITDDGILLQQLENHLTICIYPIPLNCVGQYLLKNGYVLTAFSLLMSRIKQEKIYYGYLMAMFDNTHDITCHKQEFNFYLDMGLSYLDCRFRQ